MQVSGIRKAFAKGSSAKMVQLGGFMNLILHSYKSLNTLASLTTNLVTLKVTILIEEELPK